MKAALYGKGSGDIMEGSSVECLDILFITGWATLFVLYWVQVGLLVSIMVIQFDDLSYIAWFLWFVPAFLYVIYFFYSNWELKHADKDVKIWDVWMTWDLYIVAYVLTVGMIFDRVAYKLTKQDDLGINALKSTLCITPAMLILFLQLAICPSYRKPVLSLSIFAALNIFDGIEMLETFLMQNDGLLDLDSATKGLKEFWMQNGSYFNFSSANGNGTEILKTFLLKDKHFDLNEHTERAIIAFACICFLLSSFGLARNKFESQGEVKERTTMSIIIGFLEIIGTNLPFLVIRAYIWEKHKYEAAVFIAKNIVSLVVGAVEFGILIKMLRDNKKTKN